VRQVTPQEIALFSALIRSALLLTALVTLPIALLSGLIGPLAALAAFWAAIPLCAHLTGVVPLGDTPEEALERSREEFPLIGTVSGLSVLFGLNVLFLVPAPLQAVPFLPILITSLYVMALYVLGVRDGSPDRIAVRVGVPVVLVLMTTIFLT
jgi:hypothetical protein